jgi:hypothetical protein
LKRVRSQTSLTAPGLTERRAHHPKAAPIGAVCSRPVARLDDFAGCHTRETLARAGSQHARAIAESERAKCGRRLRRSQVRASRHGRDVGTAPPTTRSPRSSTTPTTPKRGTISAASMRDSAASTTRKPSSACRLSLTPILTTYVVESVLARFDSCQSLLTFRQARALMCLDLVAPSGVEVVSL